MARFHYNLFYFQSQRWCIVAASFAAGLSDFLATKKKPTLLQRRLQKILDAPDSSRKRAILAALETRARDRLGVGATQGIDWSSIPWDKILDFLLKLLAILAPLFLATPAPAAARKSKKGLGRTLTRKRL